MYILFHITLCLLEKVDTMVGKQHLFKRSMVLVKAWCYFESHLLSSQNGLLATYALETLVLCVFDLMHEQLSISISICLSIYLPTYLPTYLPIYLSVYLSIYLPAYISIYLNY